VRAGVWQHIAVSFDHGTAVVHRDGVPIATKHGLRVPEPWTGMRLGTSAPGSQIQGDLAELRASHDPQDETRVENLAELVAVAQEFDETRASTGEVASLEDFLEQVSLVADADEIPDSTHRSLPFTMCPRRPAGARPPASGAAARSDRRDS